MSSSGVVKTFGAQKGFGFIESADVEGDVYFSARDLPAELQGQDLRLTGCTVYFELSHRPDGKPQGKQVQVEGMELEMLSGGSPQGGVNLAADPTWAGDAADPSQQVVTGEVKSFNDVKGFGFISSQMVEGDIYFQKKDVPAHLQGMPLQGYEIECGLHETPDGKYQARRLRFTQGGGCGKGACNGGFAKGGKAIKGSIGPAAYGPAAGKGGGGFKGDWGKGDWGGFQGWGDGSKGGCKGGCKGGPPAWGAGSYKGADAGFGGAGKGVAAAAGAQADGATVFGTIKNINAEKGFGFITAPGLPSDVYFKVETGVEAGMNVSFTLKWMKDGKPQGRDLVPSLAGGEMLVGTVKSFSEKNSYGFITSEESIQDVWFHQRALPDELQGLTGDALRGMTLRFNVQLKADGKPQAQDIISVDAPGDMGFGEPLAPAPPRVVKRPADYLGWGGNGAAPAKVARILPSSSAPIAIMPATYMPASKGAAYGKGMKGPVKGAKGGAAIEDAGAEGGLPTVTGFIKSFNTQKGFGFIESPEVEGDIYFKGTMLPPHLQGAPLQGSEVSFDLRYTPDGKPQAGRIQVDGM